MSGPDVTPPLAVFGDPDAAIWGVAVGGPEPAVAVAAPTTTGSEAAFAPGTLVANGGWHLTTAGGELTIAARAPEAATAGLEGESELCHVTGQLGDRPIDLRGARWPAFTADKLGSLRLLGAWFPEGTAIAMLAARPRKAAGHDRDELAVALGGDLGEVPRTVFDPRLSSTYGADGAPRRIGLELWLGQSEEGELYPRRAAGEATGATVATTTGGLRIAAWALRCHSRGHDGGGVYVLVTVT